MNAGLGFLARVVVRTVTSISGAGVFLLLPFACCSQSAVVWLWRQASKCNVDVHAVQCPESGERVTVPGRANGEYPEKWRFFGSTEITTLI